MVTFSCTAVSKFCKARESLRSHPLGTGTPHLRLQRPLRPHRPARVGHLGGSGYINPLTYRLTPWGASALCRAPGRSGHKRPETGPRSAGPPRPRSPLQPHPERVSRGGGSARLPLGQGPHEGRAERHHLAQAAPRAAPHPRVLPGGGRAERRPRGRLPRRRQQWRRRAGRHFPPRTQGKCRPGSGTRGLPASSPQPRGRHGGGGGAGGLSLPPRRALLPDGEARRGGWGGRWSRPPR